MVNLFFVALLLTSLSLFAHAKPPVMVFATQLKTEPYTETIEALGVLRANEAVTLSASLTDTVSAIHFDDGQRVTKGDVLVELTDQEEHALLEQAKAVVVEAQRQYDRVQSLVKSNLANESLLDQTRLSLDSAQASLSAVQARLADRLILAPFSGVVGLRVISEGTLVRPGDILTTLDDDSVMKLDIAVPEPFMASVSVGMDVQAKSIVDDQVFTGKIKSLDSRLDPTSRTLLVRAEIANPQHVLRPGMMMSVRLQKPMRQGVFVPEKSVVQIGHEKHVYVVKQQGDIHISQKTVITTGDRLKGKVLVTGGVEEGDWVITDGTLKVQDGTPVTIKAHDTTKSLSQLLAQ